MDFLDAVSHAIADVPQRRSAWFTPLVPAAAAIGAVALIAGLTFILVNTPDVGPSPAPAPSASVPSTVPSPSPSPSPEARLVHEGNEVQMRAFDASSEIGSITLRRGQELGGYATDPDLTSDTFLIEIQVTYELAEAPDPAEWGRWDWTIQVSGGNVDGLFVGPWDMQETSTTAGPQPALTNFPGAVVAEPGRYSGWLVFAIPRDAADGTLNLLYDPAGSQARPRTVVVREPGRAPDPVPAIPASPEPTYSYVSGMFSVMDSTEADGLFVEPDSCSNAAGGYTVSYPDSWYTNTAIGNTPACSWFSPTFFEVDDSQTVPSEIVIQIRMVETGLGQIPEYPRVFHEPVNIGGYQGWRVEDAIPTGGGDFGFVYHYAAWLDEQPTGLKILAHTASESSEDYVLNKAVLDRILASLRFTDFEADAAADAAADELFADTDKCTNPDDGYTVRFPDAWYTNTEIDGVPACSWFTPDFFEVTQPGVASDDIWISIGTSPYLLAYIGTTQVFSSEEIEIGGRVAEQLEYNPSPMFDALFRGYHYVIRLGDDPSSGPTFIAQTDNEVADDYALAKAVLDRIMASLEFTD